MLNTVVEMIEPGYGSVFQFFFSFKDNDFCVKIFFACSIHAPLFHC